MMVSAGGLLASAASESAACWLMLGAAGVAGLADCCWRAERGELVADMEMMCCVLCCVPVHWSAVCSAWWQSGRVCGCVAAPLCCRAEPKYGEQEERTEEMRGTEQATTHTHTDAPTAGGRRESRFPKHAPLATPAAQQRH